MQYITYTEISQEQHNSTICCPAQDDVDYLYTRLSLSTEELLVIIYVLSLEILV